MATFTVNGKPVFTDREEKLIVYLRETLDLTSVKNGCLEGACGTCTVLVDGRAKRACLLKTNEMEGKSVTTAEGLSGAEKAVYAYAFAEAGAVQCGFCTPGMVMSAKALIDQNPDPAPEEVKAALRGNLCRCTGYKKIEEAVLLAAKLFREGKTPPSDEGRGAVGDSMRRVDAEQKTLGTAIYADDIRMEGMLLGSAVRSAYPRARVLRIDASEALRCPGVAAVFTAKDIPGAKKIGHIVQDYDVMIPEGSVTHFLGDAIALVAAENREALERGKSLVKVEYEALPPCLSPEESLKAGAPLLHENGNILSREWMKRGNADARIAKSEYRVTNTYRVPFTEHAFLEPECAVAFIEGDTVRIISGDQGIYQTQKECAAMLGLPKERVRVTAAMVGGGFGGKEDMSVQHHAALIAFLTGRPVKVRFTRPESMLVHPKRHAMELTVTTACDRDGSLTAMKAQIVADTGAYASLGGPVLQRACTHAAGPYRYEAVSVTGIAVYTNNPPGGAFRGFGVTQSCFAIESNINQLAKLVGLTPFEIRYQNALRPGDVMPNGQIADASTAIVETLDAVRADYEANPAAGIACAMKNSGLGVGIHDTGRVRLEVRDGKVHIYSSAACIGQGMGTVQTQMVAQGAGIPPRLLVYEPPDTALSPDAGNTTASRQTLFTGEAAVRAAKALKEDLLRAGSLEALEGRSYLGEYTGITDGMHSEAKNPVTHVAYSYATQLVELDGGGRVARVVAAHDVGRAVNPKAVEGQIEGGALMGLGYALTEDFPLEGGRPTAKFGTLGLFRAPDAPSVEARIVEKPADGPALGAKGIGEISAIPAAPAAASAYENLTGKFQNKLPLTNTPYKK